ncbi:hypothetical protein HTG_03425 [Natrinema mahii]|nr:hypothetical protein HTG_03425 [Natrinema mahii]
MQLTLERTDDRTERAEDERAAVAATADTTGRQRRRIDVTDRRAADLEEFVRTNVEADAVSLEHRGGRTYLLLED